MSFVARYLPSPGRGSALSRQEILVIDAAGLGIVSIWETTAGAPYRDATRGAAFFTPDRGAQEGTLARLAAEALGQPEGSPIYATVDYDMQEQDWPAVLAYMRAFEKALAGKFGLGIYGSLRVINRAQELTTWLWQTYAWSRGKLHPAAVLYQYHNGVMIGGVQTDLDRAFNDPGWWRPGGKLVEPVPAPPEGDEIVPLVRTGDQGLAVKILQQMLNAVGGGPLAVDGRFGPATTASVRAFQVGHNLDADGVVGPATWSALADAKPTDDAGRIQELTAALGRATAKLDQIKAIIG